MKNTIVKDTLAITLITLVAGLALGGIQGITAEPIAQQRQLAKEEAYKAVFSDADSFETIVEAEDPEKDIHLYINSPGGVITAGMAIYDTMHYIKCDVSTVCIGMAASMGSFLLAGGAKGKRYALPNAEIMIHQPAGGTQGQATEIDIAAKHILRTREKLNHILAENTGRDYETICSDTERDNWMSAQEAKEYGIVDMVISSHAVQDEKK